MTGISGISNDDFIDRIMNEKLDVSDKTTSTSRRFSWGNGQEDFSMKQLLDQFEKIVDGGDGLIPDDRLQLVWNKLIEADVKGSASYFEKRGNSGMSLRQLNPAGMRKQAQFKRIASKIAGPEQALSEEVRVRLSIRKVSKNRDLTFLLNRFNALRTKQLQMNPARAVGKVLLRALLKDDRCPDGEVKDLLVDALESNGVSIGDSDKAMDRAIAKDRLTAKMQENGDTLDQMWLMEELIGKLDFLLRMAHSSPDYTALPTVTISGVEVFLERDAQLKQYSVEVRIKDLESSPFSGDELFAFGEKLKEYVNLAYEGQFDVILPPANNEDGDPVQRIILRNSRQEVRNELVALMVKSAYTEAQAEVMRDVLTNLDEFMELLGKVNFSMNKEVNTGEHDKMVDPKKPQLSLSGDLSRSDGQICVRCRTDQHNAIESENFQGILLKYVEGQFGNEYTFQLHPEDPQCDIQSGKVVNTFTVSVKRNGDA